MSNNITPTSQAQELVSSLNKALRISKHQYFKEIFPHLESKIEDALRQFQNIANPDKFDIAFLIETYFANDRTGQKLKEYLEKDFNLTDHPKKDILWSMAWEKGHAYGLHEVYNEYLDLVELVR